MSFTLRPDQLADVEKILNEESRGSINASTMGSGKTLTSVQALHEADLKTKLIIAPLNTLDGWQRTILKQTGEELNFWAAGNPESALPLINGSKGWNFIGWEYSRSMDLSHLPVDAVVYDECHRLQLSKSERQATKTWRMGHKLSKAVRERGGMVLGLSATPFGNKLAGAFGTCSAIWGKRRDLGTNAYWTFVDKYLGKHKNIYGHIEVNETSYTPGLIPQSMPLYWRHEQGFPCCEFHPDGIQADLPPRVIHRVTVPLSKSQRALYDELEDNKFVWVPDSDVPIDTQGYSIVERIRLRQICLANPTPELKQRIKDRETGEVEDYVQMKFKPGCKSSKIEAIKEIVSDLPDGERVLIFTHSAGIIPAVIAALGEKRTFGWHGGVKFSDRQAAKESFIGGGEVQIIVAQINAISDGVDGFQHACNTEIWLSMSDSMIANVQAAGRLDRPGQKKAINAYSIEAEHTIEQNQLRNLDQRETTMTEGLRV